MWYYKKALKLAGMLQVYAFEIEKKTVYQNSASKCYKCDSREII